MSVPIPQDLIKFIKNLDSFVVCAHTQPDGDATGASIAMTYILKALGKNCILYNEDGFSKWLDFLEKPDIVYTDLNAFPFEPDCVIALDCGEQARLGEKMSAYIEGKKCINIDHHLANPNYANLVNWVDSEKSSAGEMVAEIMDALGVVMTKPIAEALYVSISSDTGNFSYTNMSKSTVDLFARLIAFPIDVSDIRMRIDSNASLEKFRLWGQLYQEIQVTDEGRFAYVKVPYEYYEKFHVNREALEGFIEQIRTISGVRVALMLSELMKVDKEDKTEVKIVKASMRSHGADNVQAVLASLGGGGHRNAAGAKIKGKNFDEILEIIKPLVRKMW